MEDVCVVVVVVDNTGYVVAKLYTSLAMHVLVTRIQQYPIVCVIVVCHALCVYQVLFTIYSVLFTDGYAPVN